MLAFARIPYFVTFERKKEDEGNNVKSIHYSLVFVIEDSRL